jgi:predicted metal-dependent peptidase
VLESGEQTPQQALKSDPEEAALVDGLESRISHGLVLMHRLMPDLAIILSGLKIRIVNSKDPYVKTMAVDPAGNIYINPGFSKELTDQEFYGVLAHEALHHANGTFWRQKGRDSLLWNIATDSIMNWALAREGVKLPKMGILPDINTGKVTVVPEDPRIKLKNNTYTVLDEHGAPYSMEEIYNQLVDIAKDWDKQEQELKKQELKKPGKSKQPQPKQGQDQGSMPMPNGQGAPGQCKTGQGSGQGKPGQGSGQGKPGQGSGQNKPGQGTPGQDPGQGTPGKVGGQGPGKTLGIGKQDQGQERKPEVTPGPGTPTPGKPGKPGKPGDSEDPTPGPGAGKPVTTASQGGGSWRDYFEKLDNKTDKHLTWDEAKAVNKDAVVLTPEEMAEREKQRIRDLEAGKTLAGDHKASHSRGSGTGQAGGAIRKVINKSIPLVVDWKGVMKRFLKTTENAKRTWNVPGWRGLAAGYPSQGKIANTDKLDAIVAIDTSGSIGDKELQAACEITKQIADTAKNLRVRICLWHDVAYYLSRDITGHGALQDTISNLNIESNGTNMSSVAALLAERGIKAKVTIYITDGYVEGNPILPPSKNLVIIINHSATDPDFRELIGKKFNDIGAEVVISPSLE